MPTAIETWRARAKRERDEKRRARLRRDLPMGNFMTTSGVIEQEYIMVPDGEGGYNRVKKRKRKNPLKKLFGVEE